MSTQTARKQYGITRIALAVLTMLVVAITFAPQAQADSPPKHLKSWNGGVSFPDDTVIDSKGNVYLVNIPQDNVQKFTKDGVFIKSWGGPGTTDGKFDRPEGIGIDAQDNVYIADSSNDRIQKFNEQGDLLDVIGTEGSGNGQLSYPTDVAIGNGGAIYVTDSGNNRVQRFSAAGTYVSKWGTVGNGNSQFNNGIFGIATDPTGNVFVADMTNDRIQKFSHNGTFLTKWGSKGAASGNFNNPEGLVTDGDGNLYVADTNNDRIQKFTNNGAFVYEFGTSGDGPAGLDHPSGVSLHGDRVYVSDSFHHRMQVFGSELPLAIPDPKDPEDVDPGPGEVVFDGKNLHVRLKCPQRFRPFCKTSALPMTKKVGGKSMATKAAHRKLKPNQWTVVSFVIKAKFRSKVKKMTDRNVKLMHVTQKIKSKKIHNRKAKGSSTVFHIYKVRSAGK